MLTADVSGETDRLTWTSYVTVTSGYTTAGRTITYTYDPLGRLSDAGYSTGESYDYTYDAGDRSGRAATASPTAAPTERTTMTTTRPTS